MRFFLFFFLFTFFSEGTFALENKLIKFHNPIIKFVKSNIKVTSGYLTIENIGENDLILKSVSSNFSKTTQIHEMKIDQDVMKMKKIKNPIKISKGKKIVFKPGGLHIMFMNLNKNLILNKKERVNFEFEKHGKIKIFMKIKKISMKKEHKH
tara:strand:- start:1648 stop:2103 length:456 start_codon:yes stop_codon:yes gene_type:complete